MYSEVLLLFCVPTRSVSVPFYPYPYQFACFGQKSFKFDYPSGCVVTFHCGFNGHSPASNDVEHLYLLICHPCIFIAEMPVQTLPVFWLGFVIVEFQKFSVYPEYRFFIAYLLCRVLPVFPWLVFSHSLHIVFWKSSFKVWWSVIEKFVV